MKQRISIITLGVRDLERARRFYIDGLGLTPRPESVDGDVTFIDMGGVWLALWSCDSMAEDAGISGEGSGFPGFSLAHNVPNKEDVDTVIAQAERAGATIVRAPQDVFWGGYTAYFSDPDGFLWEVAWNPDMPFLAD